MDFIFALWAAYSFWLFVVIVGLITLGCFGTGKLGGAVFGLVFWTACAIWLLKLDWNYIFIIPIAYLAIGTLIAGVGWELCMRDYRDIVKDFLTNFSKIGKHEGAAWIQRRLDANKNWLRIDHQKFDWDRTSASPEMLELRFYRPEFALNRRAFGTRMINWGATFVFDCFEHVYDFFMALARRFVNWRIERTFG